MVTGHASSLARVATNLLQNAIVHGGGTGLIQVTVGANGWFEVRDQGPGMPAEEKLRIFRPFYRSQAVVGEGHGLGLHLSQEIVVRHGGRIRAADAPGGGANFRVVLKPGK
jgi:signal transduction histidine kinase